MNPTELKLEEVLSNKNDNLDDVTNNAPNGDAPSVEPTPTPTPAVDPATESEGYTANDVETVDEPVVPAPQPTDPETKYIADNLPEIPVRITQNGQVKELTVKSWTQLPDDVEFATKRDELAFMNALTAQENKARELQNEYRQQQANKTAQDFEARENATIRNDVTRLQNEGDLPKFKLEPDDPHFAEDPATIQIQKVLDFMNTSNQRYLERYNDGEAWRHIGFEEAFRMMPKDESSTKQAKEDLERTAKAKNVGSNNGEAETSSPLKVTVPRGISLDDIADRVEREWK